ncbi:3-methyladenine DNA glycosylase [Bacillus testis]|nr:3-methyladenine DNA glycosylase [Bacillus testis]
MSNDEKQLRDTDDSKEQQTKKKQGEDISPQRDPKKNDPPQSK